MRKNDIIEVERVWATVVCNISHVQVIWNAQTSPASRVGCPDCVLGLNAGVWNFYQPLRRCWWLSMQLYKLPEDKQYLETHPNHLDQQKDRFFSCWLTHIIYSGYKSVLFGIQRTTNPRHNVTRLALEPSCSPRSSACRFDSWPTIKAEKKNKNHRILFLLFSLIFQVNKNQEE